MLLGQSLVSLCPILSSLCNSNLRVNGKFFDDFYLYVLVVLCCGDVQTVYDPLIIVCYNVLYTSLPVLAMGVLDQDVCDGLSHRYPLLYSPGLHNLFFNPRQFAFAALHGVATSIVVFFIPLGRYIYDPC